MAWLRCFEAAARLMSFTRAAAELHLTQGAVSQQVRNLEIRLGCKLFYRQPNQLKLTSQGLNLQNEIEPALRQIERVVASLRGSRGPLNVSCSPSFALRWLMPRLGRFAREHPEIDVRLRAEFHQLDQSRFARDDLDVAIRYDPFKYPDLKIELALPDLMIPVAGKDFLSAGQKFRAENLITEILLHDADPWDGAPEYIEWETCFKHLGLDPSSARRGRQFNLSDLAIAAALACEGVAVGRLSLVYEDLSSTRLVPLSKSLMKAPAQYVVLTNGQSDSRVRNFIDWLRREYNDFQDVSRGVMSAFRSGKRLNKSAAILG